MRELQNRVKANFYRQRLMKGREQDQDHCLKISLLTDEQILEKELAEARLIAEQADQMTALLAIYEEEKKEPTPLEQLFTEALKAIDTREARARHIMNRVRSSK